MICKKVTLTSSVSTMFDLLNTDVNFCTSVSIQNPSGNDTVYYGDEAHQVMEIAADSSDTVYPASLSNLHIKGTSGNSINVLVNTQ